VLVRAHLRHLMPLPKDELLALNRSVAELGAIGRNLNQMVRAALQSALTAELRQEHALTMLGVCEALHHHVKALLKENALSWKTGHAESRP
jgi:hypothetical protein